MQVRRQFNAKVFNALCCSLIVCVLCGACVCLCMYGTENRRFNRVLTYNLSLNSQFETINVQQFQSSTCPCHGEKSKARSGVLTMAVLYFACTGGLTTVEHSTHLYPNCHKVPRIIKLRTVLSEHIDEKG